MLILSKVKKSELEFCDFLPEESEARRKFKYYCPVCLRYFTHILVSKCCQNYLCLLCAKDIKAQESK